MMRLLLVSGEAWQDVDASPAEMFYSRARNFSSSGSRRNRNAHLPLLNPLSSCRPHRLAAVGSGESSAVGSLPSSPVGPGLAGRSRPDQH